MRKNKKPFPFLAALTFLSFLHLDPVPFSAPCFCLRLQMNASSTERKTEQRKKTPLYNNFASRRNNSLLAVAQLTSGWLLKLKCYLFGQQTNRPLPPPSDINLVVRRRRSFYHALDASRCVIVRCLN